MRIAVLSCTAVIALALAGCGEEANKPAYTPPKTSATSPAAPADAPSEAKPAAGVAADNTGRNTRDDGSTLTPFDQGMSEKDMAITQSVRKAVVAHKGLSINAQNVKIIAKDGVVTLRGPVESESERAAIVSMAEQVPEVNTVINKLEIASP